MVEQVTEPPLEVDQNTQAYVVKPKETKWRIAYNFQMTIPKLEALNLRSKRDLRKVRKFVFRLWLQQPKVKL